MITGTLQGVRYVIAPHSTGFGPTVWAGEFRDDHDQPLWTLARSKSGKAHRSYPVRFGHTPAVVIDGLKATLADALTEPDQPHGVNMHRSLRVRVLTLRNLEGETCRAEA